MNKTQIGSILSIVGSAIGIIGTLINSLWLNHNLAILVWMISNPLLLVWAVGGHNKWWDGGLSYMALIVMYVVFTVSGIYAVVVGGIIWSGSIVPIVRRDLKNLAAQEGLFTYVKKPSFGTSIEICNAVMMKMPVYFVSEVYSMHPWIKVYADYVFKSIEEFKECFKLE